MINDWFQKLQFEAGKVGIDLYLIHQLVVDYDIELCNIDLETTKMTPDFILKSRKLFEMALQIEPSEREKTTETIVLLGWSDHRGSYKKAVDWGLSQNLRKTTPHIPLALTKEYPKLNSELGEIMCVVETTGLNGMETVSGGGGDQTDGFVNRGFKKMLSESNVCTQKNILLAFLSNWVAEYRAFDVDRQENFSKPFPGQIEDDSLKYRLFGKIYFAFRK